MSWPSPLYQHERIPRICLIRMRSEVQVLPGPPPALTSGNAGQHAPELIGRGGCRIKNSYLVTAPGHEPDLQSNCCSRTLVVQEGSEQTVCLCHCRRRAARGSQRKLRVQVGFLNVPGSSSALVMVGRGAAGWLRGRPRPRMTPDPLLVIVARRTRACWSRLGASAPSAGVVTDAVAREHARGRSRGRSRAAAWCG
jgi:hypothetical protein